nr:YdcF family protein [Luteimonas saliphila]
MFGKHAPRGRPDADFSARLARAAALWSARPPQRMLLLGGGPDGGPSEAALACSALVRMGVPADAPLVLEDRSRDTLQNLRNARALLERDRDSVDPPRPVTLLSSRYHLARCALFARNLGLRWELCAAEPTFSWRPATLWRLAGEAAYVCWVDVGTRWARLIGHQRMLARIS